MDGVKIRIFGSADCDICKNLIKAFEHHAIQFEYVDANAPDKEALCDKYKVDQLPHIQAVYADNDKPFLTHVGYVGPMQFVEHMKQYSKQLADFTNSYKQLAVNNVDAEAIQQQMKEAKKNVKSGCSSCGRKNNAKS